MWLVVDVFDWLEVEVCYVEIVVESEYRELDRLLVVSSRTGNSSSSRTIR